MKRWYDWLESRDDGAVEVLVLTIAVSIGLLLGAWMS